MRIDSGSFFFGLSIANIKFIPLVWMQINLNSYDNEPIVDCKENNSLYLSIYLWIVISAIWFHAEKEKNFPFLILDIQSINQFRFSILDPNIFFFSLQIFNQF